MTQHYVVKLKERGNPPLQCELVRLVQKFGGYLQCIPMMHVVKMLLLKGPAGIHRTRDRGRPSPPPHIFQYFYVE